MKPTVLLLTLLVAGCSHTPVETQFYLLRQQAAIESREMKPSPDFSLGDVSIASYIDQPGLILEVSPGQVRPARHHEWAEPMHRSVRIFLQREISIEFEADLFSSRFSPASTVVEIRVDQLHGTSSGEAILTAHWWTIHKGELKSSYQYTSTEPLEQDGYAALAKAEAVLLSGLAASIANTLKALR
jgi:uncharacterized lipoprotein YmbA